MRERTTSASGASTATSYTATNVSGSCSDPTGPVTSYVAHSSTNVDWTSEAVMHDVVTPNWYDCLKRGLIINNPMDRTVTATTSNVVTISNRYKTRRWGSWCTPTPKWYDRWQVNEGTYPSMELFLNWWGWPDVPSINTESLAAQALHKARAGQELSTFQALVFAAELKESVLSLRQLYKGCLDIIKKAERRATRRRNSGNLAIDSASSLAEKWMYVRYAIRPLVYDVISCLETLNGKTQAIGERFTSRGFVEEKEHVVDTFKKVLYGGEGGNSTTLEINMECITDYRASARSGVLSRIEALSPLNKWGFDQPIEAVWELIPLSFVFDWFFDIGTTLEALTPEFGLKQLASWTTVKTNLRQIVSITDSDQYFTTLLSGYEDTGTGLDYTNFGCSRTISTTVRTPDPTLSLLPRFRCNLDAAKVADLAIIAKQMLNKIR